MAGAAVGAEGDYAAAGMAAAALARAEIEALSPTRAAEAAEAVAEGGEEAGDAPSTRRHEELLWLLTAPGQEEAVLRGLRLGLRPRTVVLGSSSADETLGARWWQLALSPSRAAASAGFCPSSAKAKAKAKAEAEAKGEAKAKAEAEAGAEAGATKAEKAAAEAAEGVGPSIISYAAEGVVVINFRPSLDFTPVLCRGLSRLATGLLTASPAPSHAISRLLPGLLTASRALPRLLRSSPTVSRPPCTPRQ